MQRQKKSQYFRFLLSSQTSPFYSPLQFLMLRVNEINKCILTTNRKYKKLFNLFRKAQKTRKVIERQTSQSLKTKFLLFDERELFLKEQAILSSLFRRKLSE